jgi:hypothetical protein
MSKYYLTRDVSVEECPWLAMLHIGNLPKGTILYASSDAYGCCAAGASCVSLKRDAYPYFQMPGDALKEYFGVVFSDN